MNSNKSAKSLTFRRGSGVSQENNYRAFQYEVEVLLGLALCRGFRLEQALNPQHPPLPTWRTAGLE